jgi:amino-acid N-acetyltransferase
MEPTQSFVSWFRHSSPYIHAHRNKTFIIFFGGEAVQAHDFSHHIHDIALLSSLGIRLVLVHGIRPQIDKRLDELKIPAQFHDNLRITDDLALQCVKEAAGTVRVEIEALLSMGISNTPMASSRLSVVSGNFVTAKPLGVLDGIDYIHTGAVRRIENSALQQQLEARNIVLISPIGYSPSGEVFNLSAEQVAMQVAISLKADKLILLTEQDVLASESGLPIRQMTAEETGNFLENNPGLPNSLTLSLKAAVQSCQEGVKRVHLINRHIDGVLLQELFSHDGIGTLISSTPFEVLRPATMHDIGGILELMTPLQLQGKLSKRTREKLEMDIGDYVVLERDGLIIGSIALHHDSNGANGLIASLAVHVDYQGNARGQRLFEYIGKKAKKLGIKKLFVLSTQTAHWFIERGFQSATLADLPEAFKLLYHPERNSKVLSQTYE